jgi:hypothetical protein
MYALATQHEYIAVKKHTSGYVICAPFGIDSYRSPFITYYDYTENNRIRYGWFHFVCSF